MYGRIISEHGANPYLDPASAFPSDPYLPPVGGDWRDYPAPYGPLWLWISALVTALAGGQQLAALLAIKLIAVVAHLPCQHQQVAPSDDDERRERGCDQAPVASQRALERARWQGIYVHAHRRRLQRPLESARPSATGRHLGA